MMMSVSKHLSLFFLALFLFFKLCCTLVITCHEIENQSLLIFKRYLQDPENSLSSWNGEVDCCKWKGVHCSNLTGHVDQLLLQTSYLGGQISHSLLNLKYLKHLDLSLNLFNEEIPSFIGSLTSLEYLNLSGVEFQGKVPRNIGNLSKLHTLSLEYCSSLQVHGLEWLSGLSKLEYLNMNDVNLSRASHWKQQVIDKLPSLVELHLSGCNLNNTYPLREVNNITSSNLAILDLGWNDLNDIVPRWIFHFSNLIYLDLSSNNYEGPIPNFSNTTKLQYIDLSVNNFNSSIPEWLYALKDLEHFDLGGNNLQGAISNSISNMTSLNTLGLYDNKLSGKLPRGITNLCKLQRLDLGDNNLQGEVSDSFENISDCFIGALEFLFLKGNKFSGRLTQRFGEFKNLQYLDLSNNSFSGVIPSNLGNLSSLQWLNLQDNKFTGTLPESIGQLSNLVALHITGNMLEGAVTETHFARLSRLVILAASRNQLTLNVSPNWIPPFKITSLSLKLWNLSSPIPSWLVTQKMSIDYLDLSFTGIYGNVPNWIWSLRQFDLSHNQLHGKIPVIRDPEYVYLGSNKFSGQLPRISTSLYSLDLSNNLFSGELSHVLCSTMTDYALQNLNLGGNRLTGELPNCFMNWSSLVMLNLGDNKLSGRIPDSIGFLASLKSLNLYGNNLYGNIPSLMHNCTELLKMDLSDNNLSGNMPKWIMTSLSKLVVLIVKSNKFSGEINLAICQLSSLQILDLSDNMFSGKIPRCVDNFTAMVTKRSLEEFDFYFRDTSTYRDSASIATKGTELTYQTILPYVTSIDLSRNNLSGDIPVQITSLVGLGTLNLSGNQITGIIPDTIGNMKNLESLDFSINSLSGELPDSFAALTSLNHLNLFCNKLTGRIPKSTQLQGFNESSFIGNNLCGPPLTISCSNISGGEAPGTMHSKDQEGDKPKIEWLYVFTSLGCAVGLSITLTTLFLKRSWREAYFEFVEDILDNAYVYVLIQWRKLKGGLSLSM